MMFSKLQINGLKSIRNYIFDLAPLVLLTGLNSSGKSTALQGVRMLFNAIKGESIYLDGYGTFKDILFSPTSSMDKGQTVPTGIHIKMHIDQETWASIKLTKEQEPLIESSSMQDAWYFHFLSADRQGPVPFFAKHPIQAETAICFFPGNKGEYLYACLQSRGDEKLPSILLHESHPGYTLRQNVNAWISDIVANANINLEETPDSLDVASITVDGYRQANVGFGVSYTLSVIVSLLGAASLQHNIQTDKNILLTIENPEAHLHGLGQTKMGYLLALTAMSGVQLFVETHSEFIIDGVRLAIKEKLGGMAPEDVLIYFFDRKNGESNIEKISIDETGKLSSWPSGFFDQGRKNKAKLLG